MGETRSIHLLERKVFEPDELFAEKVIRVMGLDQSEVVAVVDWKADISGGEKFGLLK